MKLKRIENTFLTMAVSATMMILMASQVFAADKVTSVSITIDETRLESGEIWTAEPAVSSNKYSITDYSWSSDYELWEPGSDVTLKLELEPEDGYSFSSDVKVSCGRGEVAKKSKSGSTLNLRINYKPRVTLAEPTGLYYEDDLHLVWDKVEYAGGYEVKLYRDGSSFKTISVSGRSNTEADLSEYATDDYIVTASVRAVPASGKSSYITASEWVEVGGEGVSSSGNSTVVGSFKGSGSNRYFVGDDDNKIYGWQYINGTWYYFDESNNGYTRANGWSNINGTWYYFDAEGRMQENWVKDGAYWYFLGGDGAMKTGWQRSGPNSPWYFLNTGERTDYPVGAMLVDTTTPDGYTVNANGEWQ